MSFILASQSPRRRELLQKLNIPFTVRVADVDETMDKDLPLTDAVAQLSLRKAAAIAREQDDIVIAADTIVVLDNTVLGKPRDEKDAFQMLKNLSGRSHQVMTGVTVLQGDSFRCHTEVTEVFFRTLTDEEILAYIRTKDPMDKSASPIWYDKAGGYGIQTAFGAKAVERIHGDFYSVMGLPVSRLYRVLRDEFGFYI